MPTEPETAANLCPKCERPKARNGRCYPCAKKSKRACKTCGTRTSLTGRCPQCRPYKVGGTNPRDPEAVAAVLECRRANPNVSKSAISRLTHLPWNTVDKVLREANGTPEHNPYAGGHAYVAKATDSLPDPPPIDPMERVLVVIELVAPLGHAVAVKVLETAAAAIKAASN